GVDISTFATPKTVYRNNMLYWINGKDRQVVAFSTATNSIVWTFPVDQAYDIALSVSGDTIFVGGDFWQFGAQFNRSIGAISRVTGTELSWDPSAGGVHDFGVVKSLIVSNNKLYIGGKFAALGYNNLMRLDIATQTTDIFNANPNDTVCDMALSGNQLYIAGSFTQYYGSQNRTYLAAINAANNTPVAALNPAINAYLQQIELYNGQIFISGNFTTVNSTARNYLASVGTTGILSSWNPSVPSGTILLNRMRNRLYVTDIINSAFQVYCLAPGQPAAFTTSTATVCAGQQNVTYTVSVPPYATGYNWTYSGTGAVINGTGNSVTVSFSANATSGNLSVSAVSYCNLPGAPRSMSITVNPLPGADAGKDDTLNCYFPQIILNGNSVTPGVNYTWLLPDNSTQSGQNITTPLYMNGDYLLTVTDTITGCMKNDTVNVAIDTVSPDVTVPAQPAYISCTAPALLDGSSSTPNVAIWWRDVTDMSNTYHPDPYATNNLANHYMLVQDLYNGCKDSAQFAPVLNQNIPNAVLLSHPLPVGPVAVDTITCAQTNVVLLGGSDSLSTVFSWTDTSGTVFPNPATLTATGLYTLHIVRTDNGCIDSSLVLYIAQDITPPNLSILPGNTNLTCSNSSTILDAQSLTGNTTLNWTGPNNFTANDPATASDTGWYFITAVRADNGCSRTDSVHVSQLPLIIVSAGNDTLVCKNTPVTLTAIAQGTIPNLIYNWSNGPASATNTVSVPDTTAYIINASGSNGCAGSDTVIVFIPPDISDSLDVFQDCDGSNTGNIQVYASGGIPPYTYSVNNSPFTASPVFSNYAFGTYAITIMDSLGCTHTDMAVINQYSNLPQPYFLAATNTMQGDTLVLVDISNPHPDSVQWILPFGAQIIGGSMFSPVILLPDTGYFSITMQAFFGNCVLDTTKLVHAGPIDTSFATQNNLNGIDSLWLYPNPNNGQFTVGVDLFKKQNLVIQVFDGLSVLHFQQHFQETDYISLPVGLSSSLPDGTYLLRAIGEYDARNIVFMISH
ncbi:MAG: hypothetical protein FD123_2889, partial [Bacteroidetes bacterium]